MNHCLIHLHGQEDAKADVLVVDFDTLSCIKAVASNVSEWGCSLTTEEAGGLRKNIGIRLDENSRLSRATITGVRGDVVSVIFPKQEEQVHDKRRERRNQVEIPVKISDREGVTELTVVIVDAGKNGCRVKGKGLKTLPEEVVLHLKNFERPVLGEFAWRNDAAAGIRLIWDVPETIG